MSQPVHVAVGVIVNAQQQILIALRHDSSHQGGLWEFPGGKVEANESVQQALIRELEEELGINAQRFQALTQIHHDYGDKTVHLDVWWVTAFSGEPVGREGQPLKWVAAAELTDFDFPKANTPIIDAVLQSLS